MEPGSSSVPDLADALRALYARTAHGIKLGLGVEEALLARLGHPHLRMPHIHVAGTNGKGSVCAMIESILRAAGYKTGLYTSPHLVRFNERIRVAGRCITDEELARMFRQLDELDRELAAAPGGRPGTFFEFTTALAFEYFRQQKVDIVVLETGLGGRLDATNVVTPLVSVITRIDIEHTAYLGDTIEQIAAEKGGIIKPGKAVVTGAMPEEAREVIRQLIVERRAIPIPADQVVSVRRLTHDLRGQRIKIDSAGGGHRPILLPLLGRHQIENAAVAVAALEHLNESSPFVVGQDAVKQGLETVVWPARCQVLSEDPVVILDSAHNPNAARALAETIGEVVKGKDIGLVFGLLSDKDAQGFIAPFASLAKRAWSVPVRSERARPPEELAGLANAAGLETAVRPLEDALSEARAWAKERGGAICIAGSLFLAGELLEREGEELFG